MALTKQDLTNIESIFEKYSTRTEARFNQIDARFDHIDSRIERMESRLLFSIELLQRDGFDTLEDHERRIRKLEKIQTS